MKFLNKTIVRDIISNIIYLILVVIYFICFNTQGILLKSNILTQYINVSSMTFLVIAIGLFEIGFRKDKIKIFINGIEFLLLAILTLLIRHIPKVLSITMNYYTQIVTYAFIAYYILKLAIIYTKMKQDQLKSLSDIKEIVKDEPTKKASKRKNIKVKEGN